MANIKIKKLKFKSRIFLAPMLEPNDIAFRLLCKRAGAGLTYTGMVSPLSKQKIYFDDCPAVQLFGNTNLGFGEFIKSHDDKVSLWDFNLGCPSKLSKKLGHGAFMHKDFENIEKILKTMKENTSKPISIKLRKSPQALQIAKLASKYCDLISIHPRTLKQGYSGLPDYEFAIKLRDSVPIPIIYSGDLKTKEEINAALKDFPFVFVGRAAFGNPGIFGKGKNIEFKDYLKLATSKKYDIPFRQIKYQAMLFSRGRKMARKLRAKLIDAKSVKDINRIMG